MPRQGGGYAGGGVPFGDGCLRGGKKIYVNMTEAIAVWRVFEIRQSFPDMTLKNIAEFMKAEGYKGRKGADFNIMLVKVANTFGVSRQTVCGRIKNFEENRLQEFLQDGRVA